MIKKSKYLFIAISLFLLSCNSNPWKGKKYYVLNCKINDYVATLEEIQLNFISSEYVEIKATLNSSLGDLKTYKNDQTLGKLVKTYKYTSINSDGMEMIDIPGLSLNFRTITLTNGDRKASNEEIFYKNSIVDILNTTEAEQRVRIANVNDEFDNIFVKLLKSNKKSKVSIPALEEQAKGFEGE